MTVQLTPGAGPNYTSTLFTAAVNGVAATVYGRSKTGNLGNPTLFPFGAWQVSWLKIGTNETLSIEVTRIAGAITSARLYPDNVGATVVVASGKAQVTAPPDVQLRLEINGDRRDVVYLFCDPLKPTIDPASVAFGTLGSVTEFTAGQKVHFPAGTYAIGGPYTGSLSGDTNPILATARRFKVNNNCRIYIDAGAVIEGNFDVTGTTGVIFEGAGVVSGRIYDTGAIQSSLTYEDEQTFAPFMTTIGSTPITDNRLSGLVICDAAAAITSGGFSSIDHCHAINPWWGGSDGLAFMAAHPLTFTSTITSCLLHVGDDVFYLETPLQNHVIRKCFGITANNGIFTFGYWPPPPTPSTRLIEDCHAMHLGQQDTDAYPAPMGTSLYPWKGVHAVVKCWMDGYESEGRYYGIYNVTFTNLRIYGTVMTARALAIQNYSYPYLWGGTQRERFGTAASWLFDGFYVEAVNPIRKSLIEGFDRNNTPCNLSFNDVRIGGRLVDAGNFLDYFALNQHPYHIYVGGRALVTIVDICNLALSHIGESTPVASVAPADGTAGADACSRFYNLAIQECLERHAWGFATRRHELVLVDDEEHPNYEHVYEVPADVLAPTKVMREGDRDDSEGMPRVQWVIEDNADGDRRLYTNQEAFTLVYVTSLANRERYSPLFITYASWVLAAMVAPYLMKGAAGAEAALRCEQMAALKLREAMAQDNKARKVIADHVPGAIRARG